MSSWNPKDVASNTERYTNPGPNRPMGTKQKRVNSAAAQKKPLTKAQRRLAGKVEAWERVKTNKSVKGTPCGNGLPMYKPGSNKR